MADDTSRPKPDVHKKIIPKKTVTRKRVSRPETERPVSKNPVVDFSKQKKSIDRRKKAAEREERYRWGGDVFTAPPGLSPYAEHKFKEIINRVPKGYFKQTDMEVLVVMAQALERHAIMDRCVVDEGTLLEDSRGGFKANPAISAVKQQAEIILTCVKTLRLRPEDREKWVSDESGTTDDGWGDVDL